MTGAQQQRDGDKPDTRSGRCIVCGKTWIAVEADAFRSSVSRHITGTHRDQPMDKNLIEEFELVGGGD